MLDYEVEPNRIQDLDLVGAVRLFLEQPEGVDLADRLATVVLLVLVRMEKQITNDVLYDRRRDHKDNCVLLGVHVLFDRVLPGLWSKNFFLFSKLSFRYSLHKSGC